MSIQAKIIKAVTRRTIKRHGLNEEQLVRHLRKVFNNTPVLTLLPRKVALSQIREPQFEGDHLAIPNPSTTVLYLHGGGYVSGGPVTHRALTSHLAKLADASVAVADYRLAPEHPFPAALDDAHRAYLALLEKGHAPERLAVAGDSAGGGLTLALLQRLRDEGQPLPACALMFSPWVDLTLAETPLTVPGEAMLNRQWLAFAAEAYAGDQRDSAGASPLLGNLDGLPPLLIQTGSDEILANDSERLAEALDRADCDARYQSYPGRWHVFQLHAGMLHDADLALAECRDFLHQHWR